MTSSRWYEERCVIAGKRKCQFKAVGGEIIVVGDDNYFFPVVSGGYRWLLLPPVGLTFGRCPFGGTESWARQRGEEPSFGVFGGQECLLAVENRRISIVGVVRVPGLATDQVDRDGVTRCRVRVVEEPRVSVPGSRERSPRHRVAPLQKRRQKLPTLADT